jgi:eukaryotic-like serine/threonine-protein kinase
MSSRGLDRIGKFLGISRRARCPTQEQPRATAVESASSLTTQTGERHESGSSETAPQTAPAAFLLPPGRVVVGRYVVQRAIGRGGMGEVYEAQDRLLNETVALKTLRAHLTWDLAAIGRFQKEIQLARKVTHNNVCRVLETGLLESDVSGHANLPFFIMELLHGETLARRIRRTGRLSREEAFPIAVQMAQGLQAAHSAGIVHADFKSGNVILVPGERAERAVITDFGLSRITPTPDASGATRARYDDGHMEGTMAYMSPEQMSGGAVTTASDIYSFGIVLFEMATGQLPFDERHVLHGAMQRATGEGSHARSLVPDLDTRWDAAIRRCLQTAPERRFASAGDVAAFLGGSRWRYWSRREWAVRSAAVGVPAVAGGGYWLWSRRPYEPRPVALDWYQKGVAALHSMTYGAARRALEQAVAADPGFALAHANLARAYQELNYSELAKESMLRAVTIAQESRLTSRDRLKLRAVQLLVSRDYERALPVFRELERSARPPEKRAAALESGWLAQQREDTEGAAAAYVRALKLDASYAAARLRLGYILGRRRNVDAAVTAFHEAETLYAAESNYEGVTECLLQEASLLNRSSRSAEADQLMERALVVGRAAGSTYQQIRLQLVQGVAARNMGDTARSRTLARQAIDRAVAEKMDGLATSGLIDLGNSYFIDGYLAEAEQAFQKARDLAVRARMRREESRALLSLGSLYEQKRRPDEARQCVEAVLPFYRQAGYRREYVQAMTLLGRIHGQRADFDAGLRVLREILPDAVQLQDRRSEGQVRYRLADNLRDQAAWPEALAEFERSAVLMGQDPAARLRCVELYWKLGRRQDALRALTLLQTQLKDSKNRVGQRELLLMQTDFAYFDGRLSEAAALARQALTGTLNGGMDLGPRLIVELVRIRSDVSTANAAPAAGVIDGYVQAGLPLEAAAARLSVAEALMLAPKPGRAAMISALGLAREAIGFFEPRRVWESTWRAHWAAARAAEQPGESETHKAAARAALEQLRKQWPAEFVGGYLERPEISRFLNLMKL